METPVTALEAIQAILAPALGISAVGLLLLGLNNRYSSIINRIRLLNDEKRRYFRQLADSVELGYAEKTRFMSVTNQTRELLLRSRYVRNAIMAHLSAVGLFVATSTMIALNLFVVSETLRRIPLVLFVGGMIGVLVGVVYSGLEIARSYRIILIEVHGDE
ncbi:MAG: DUF2721 domain-containing protein [Bacteroidota bacterium]